MPLQDLPRDTLLAFDTSTERLAVAVLAGEARAVDNQPGGAAASAALLPAIEALLQQSGRSRAQVAAVAFGRGPGAFTGLRTSCAVAQGLAFGLGLPVLPIDSLLIVAEQARQQAGGLVSFEVGVVMDARMGEVYAGRYRWEGPDWQGPGWQALQAPGLWAPADLAAAWAMSPPPASTGSGLDLGDGVLQAVCPADRRIDAGDDRAGALLALAELAWRTGAGVDAAQALPLYLRDKVALTTAERAAAKAGAVTAVSAGP